MSASLQEIEEVLANPRRGLRLPPVLAEAFEAATGASRISSTRQFLFLALVADVLALALDAAHGSLQVGLIVRLGLVAPALAVCILLLTSRRPVWLQGLLTAIPVLLGLTSIVLIGLSMTGLFPELYLSAAGMAAFFVNAALPLRFPHAVALALVTITSAIALVLTCHGANNSMDLAGTLLFNSIVTLLTLQLSYRSERNRKLTFLYELRSRCHAEDLLRANANLERLSSMDPLTGLANRRALQTSLDQSRAQARGSRDWFGVLLVDIDHFKLFNDAAGHAAGDACLKAVAEVIQAEVRSVVDTVARFGGEEFAVVMPGADIRSVRIAGERICRAVAGQAIPHPGLGADQCVTVSIGAAMALDSEDWRSDTALRRADTALYQAKAQGRNRSVFDDPGSKTRRGVPGRAAA